jgi:queuine tRNA-ribosyltransferase
MNIHPDLKWSFYSTLSKETEGSKSSDVTSHLVDLPSIGDRCDGNEALDTSDNQSDLNHESSSATGRRAVDKPGKKRKSHEQLIYPPPPDPSEFPSWAYEARDFFRFEVVHQSTVSQARVGRIHTPHGTIDTPGFVAVATNGALKGVDFPDADAAGQQLVFANTYHLLLHPGADIVEAAGGIHQWTNRHDRPFITDSGGFQVFSLAYGSVQEELSSGGELKRSQPKGKKRDSAFKWRHDVTGKDAVKVSEEG